MLKWNPRFLKGKGQDSSVTKNYCINISIQKITLIYKFILKKQKVMIMAILDRPTQIPLNQA